MISVLAEGLQYPEGPVSCRDGRVLVCEVQGGTIATIHPDGAITRSPKLCEAANGMAFGPDGCLYLCDNGGFLWRTVAGLTYPVGEGASYQGGQILRVDPDSWATTKVLDTIDGRRLSAPNDIVFDDSGGFYFTDMGKGRADVIERGRICYVNPDGIANVVASPLLTPNGIGLSADQSRLLWAETASGRLWYWELDGPGKLAGVGPTTSSSGVPAKFLGQVRAPGRVDSFAMDSDDNVLVGTLDLGLLSVVAPDGSVLKEIDFDGETMVTNAAFDVKDLRRVYVTLGASGRLAVTDWSVEGQPLSFNGEKKVSK